MKKALPQDDSRAPARKKRRVFSRYEGGSGGRRHPIDEDDYHVMVSMMLSFGNRGFDAIDRKIREDVNLITDDCNRICSLDLGGDYPDDDDSDDYDDDYDDDSDDDDDNNNNESIWSLPGSIGRLDGLVTLDLENGTKLKSLPEEIRYLTNLKTLNLCRTRELKRLPEGIRYLTKLEVLHLGETRKLKRLPEGIGYLKNLEDLDATFSAIETLPGSIGQLQCLKRLCLDESSLTKLPEEIGCLTNLEELNLHATKIDTLPASIGQLKKLIDLNLTSSAITHLPEEIGCLESLIDLELEDTKQLENLPETIGDLTNLKDLRIDNSSITALPETIGNLVRLERLGLSDLNVSLLPDSFWKLKGLDCLTLHDSGVPEVKAGDPEFVLVLFRRLPSLTSLPSLTDSFGVKDEQIKKAIEFFKSVNTTKHRTTLIGTDERSAGLNPRLWPRFLASTKPENLGQTRPKSFRPVGRKLLRNSFRPPKQAEFIYQLLMDGMESFVTALQSHETTSRDGSGHGGMRLRSGRALVPRPPDRRCRVFSRYKGGSGGRRHSIDEDDYHAMVSMMLSFGNRGFNTIDRKIREDVYLNTDDCNRICSLDLGKDYYDDDESIWSLPGSIGRLDGLVSLSLEGRTELKSLPEEIRYLTNLKTLNLCRTSRLRSLPEEIRYLTNLKTLNLSGTSGFKRLPEGVGYLKNLEDLDVTSAAIKTLPGSIGQLQCLKRLNLYESSLTKLPEEIGRLTNLEELCLHSTKIDTLPASIGQLKKLENLDLSSSAITHLPEEIGCLESLTCLELEGTKQLENLPKTIGDLINLEYLRIDNSSITALPCSIGRLKNLEGLMLRGTPNLSELPETFGNLVRLERLGLSDSNVSSLPDSFWKLKVLGVLMLEGCDVPEVKAGDPEFVLMLFRRLPSLTFSCGVKDEQIKKAIEFFKSVNTTKHRSTLVGTDEKSAGLNPKLWPRFLASAKPEKLKLRRNSFRPKQAEFMYQLLVDGTESFATALQSCDGTKA